MSWRAWQPLPSTLHKEWQTESGTLGSVRTISVKDPTGMPIWSSSLQELMLGCFTTKKISFGLCPLSDSLLFLFCGHSESIFMKEVSQNLSSGSVESGFFVNDSFYYKVGLFHLNFCNFYKFYCKKSQRMSEFLLFLWSKQHFGRREQFVLLLKLAYLWKHVTKYFWKWCITTFKIRLPQLSLKKRMQTVLK